MLVNQDDFHAFFQKNDGKEFVTCATQEYVHSQNVIKRFVAYYNPNFVQRILNILKYKRYRQGDYIVSFGGNWASVTEEFVNYIIQKEKWIKRHFQHGYCCDEVYKQCLILNSRFKEFLYLQPRNGNTISFNMRYTDWSEGKANPKTFVRSDKKKILASNCLIARKFNADVDQDIIDIVVKSLKISQNNRWEEKGKMQYEKKI